VPSLYCKELLLHDLQPEAGVAEELVAHLFGDARPEAAVLPAEQAVALAPLHFRPTRRGFNGSPRLVAAEEPALLIIIGFGLDQPIHSNHPL
jgi:hypothetical protein